jgi:hypothetical protein
MAWAALQDFIHDVRQFAEAAAQDRFRQNLGSPLCTNCDGLKAGPDVVATCFQLGRCYFANRKTSDATDAQRRLIARLAK